MLTARFFTFDRSWNLSTCLSQNSMSCSGYLWRGLIKNKGRVGLFQVSQKERLFHVFLYQPSDNLGMLSPFLQPSKKFFLSPSVWARREYIWKLNWKESLLIYFENWQGAPCHHRQSRNRMMHTFIIVDIVSICMCR